MPRQNDITWALILPEELTKPLLLAPLQQLINYTDYTGELSRQLGDSGEPGRTYPGASAISQLGRGASGDHNQNDMSPSRPDHVERFYKQVLSKGKRQQELAQILKMNGATPSLTFKIFDRYWGTADFPLDLPDKQGLEKLLGINGEFLKKTSVLRSAVYFFMRVYSELDIDAKNWLINRLSIEFTKLKKGGRCPRSLQTWVAVSSLLFSTNPANALAESYNRMPEKSFGWFASHVNLPEHSSLFSSTRLESLCIELLSLPHQPDASHKDLLDRIFSEKDERIDPHWTVAAKCLEILVNRSIDELSGMPSDPWCDIIVDLGCHPDPKLSGQATQRYWHWANSRQIDTARMAFVRRDLEVVFEYLKQAAQRGRQTGGHMVAPRVDFYRKLLRNRLIRDTRLFLGRNVDWELRTRMKRDQFWDLHDVGDPDLCILALKLADEVNLTTGTKSFPMRFYRFDSQEFSNLWEGFSPSRNYPVFKRHHFMHDSPVCIRKTHQGDWKWAVINQVLPDPFLGRVDWSHHNL